MLAGTGWAKNDTAAVLALVIATFGFGQIPAAEFIIILARPILHFWTSSDISTKLLY